MASTNTKAAANTDGVVEQFNQKAQELSTLQSTDQASLTKIAATAQSLNQLYSSVEHDAAQVAKVLANKELPKVTSVLLEKLDALQPVDSDKAGVWEATKAVYALNGDLTGSETREYADRLAKTVPAQILMTNVCKYVNANDKSKTAAGKSERVQFLARFSLSIIHNIICRQRNKQLFSQTEFKDCLVKLTGASEEESSRVLATVCLAFLVTESEGHLLHAAQDCLLTLLKYIEEALADTETRCSKSGLLITGLLYALAALTVNDGISKTLIDNGGVALLKKCCDPANMEEMECATETICNLLFDAGNLEVIKKKENIEQFLKDLQAKHESKLSDTVKKNLTGALWLIRGELSAASPAPAVTTKPATARSMPPAAAPAGAAAPAAAATGPKIFFSYCWAQQPSILKIAEEMKKNKVNYWLDVERMQGDTLDAMSKGIEESDIILMCFSSEYFSSANCRMEAKYAVSKKKTIVPLLMQAKYQATGWLGFILGTSLWYDFSNKDNFGKMFGQLYKALTGTVSKEVTPPVKKEEVKPASGSGATPATGAGAADITLKPEVLKWSSKDVDAWLKSQKLDDLAAMQLEDFNGALLARFLRLQKQAPETFYGWLKDDLGLSLVKRMAFCEAVEKTLTVTPK